MEAGSRRLVFFDLECAGLDPKRHPIIQIAAVAVDEALEPIEAFETKLRFDERRANKNSLRKNHYHPGIWAKEGREPEEVARSFAEFLRRHATIPMMGASGSGYKVAQLAAHNADFDGSFLQAWYERFGVYLPARKPVLCTLQRAMWYFSETECKPPKDLKLATLCHHFNVPFHAASAHEALADVIATLGVYRVLSSTDRLNLNRDRSTNRIGTHLPSEFLNP
jgi:DNA polymerase III epsilon subunit-like protein